MSISTIIVRDSPSRAPGAAVAVEALSYSYGDRDALDALTLDVPRGCIYGLLGPNGSGKSTLLSLLIGRRRPGAGGIRIFGEAPSDDLRRRIGVLFQEPSLDPLMTARETLALHGRIFGMRRHDIAVAAVAALESVGLTERADAFTSSLSGGMKRRLEAARALMTAPDLVLLDEPTLALDPDARRALWECLLQANGAGATLLVATNDVGEAERYCDRVALLDHGRVVAEGTPADLKRGLRHDAVRIEWGRGAEVRAGDLAAWPGVGSLRTAGSVTHATVDAAAPFVTRLFQDRGGDVHAIRIEEATLEDAYFQVVGRSIREAGDETPPAAEPPRARRRFGRAS